MDRWCGSEVGGTLFAWGSGFFHQLGLGNGRTSDRMQPTRVRVRTKRREVQRRKQTGKKEEDAGEQQQAGKCEEVDARFVHVAAGLFSSAAVTRTWTSSSTSSRIWLGT